MTERAVIILNVDGDGATRTVASQAFARAGYQVRDAVSGQQAIDLMAAVLPHLVVLRSAGSEADDAALRRRLKRDFPGTLILQVLGPGIASADRDDADAVVAQPVDPPRLVASALGLLRPEHIDRAAELSGSAHDFNNLFLAIRGGLELIQRRTAEPRIAGLAALGLAAAERGSVITRKLQSLARRERLDLVPVDVNGLIRVLAKPITRLLGPGVKLACELDPAIPPARGHGDQLELAILVAASAAGEAMPRGGTLRLRTAAIDYEGEELGGARRQVVEIRVLGQGSGLPPDRLNRSLDPSTGTAPDWGLSKAKGIVRACGGVLVTDDGAGHGAAIRILLPIGPPADHPG